MRTSTSLRWRSAKVFSTAAAWSESRWTRTAATICGCSWRSISPIDAASIHFRPSIPEMSPFCRMRSISRLALSSSSAFLSTLLDVVAGVGDERAAALRGARELGEHLVEALLRHRRHARDRRAEALHLARREVPEHGGGFLLAERHQEDGGVFEAGFVERHGRCFLAGSGGFAAADPAADDAGDRRRVVLGERLRAFDLAQVARARRAAADRRARRRRRRRSASRAAPSCAGRAENVLLTAGRTRPKKTSTATRARPTGSARGADQVDQLGALPERRLARRSSPTARRLNGALMTLTESPRSLLKPIDSRTSAVIFSISSAPSGTCVVLPLASVTLRLLTTTRGVEPLDVAGRALGDANGLVDLVVGHRLAPAAAAGGDAGRRALQRLRRAGERRGRGDRRLVRRRARNAAGERAAGAAALLGRLLAADRDARVGALVRLELFRGRLGLREVDVGGDAARAGCRGRRSARPARGCAWCSRPRSG